MQIEWKQENANQMVYYKDKIGVCNMICFCQCNKHPSIAILLVKPRIKQSQNNKYPMYVLPGGKRDFKSFKQTEPCWDAVVREFEEEVDDNLNSFCKKKCRYFEETVQVDLDINMVTNEKLKQSIDSSEHMYRNNFKNNDNSINKQNMYNPSINQHDIQRNNSIQILESPNQNIQEIPENNPIDSELINSNFLQNSNVLNNKYQQKDNSIFIQRRPAIGLQKVSQITKSPLEKVEVSHEPNIIGQVAKPLISCFQEKGESVSLTDQCASLKRIGQSSIIDVLSKQHIFDGIDNEKRTIQVDRRIRSYYIEVSCQDLPNKEFGRFHLYEIIERTWFNLEDIIFQFKDQYNEDKKKMIISPKIFRSISIFGGKLVNVQQKQLQKLNYIYNQSNKIIEIYTESQTNQTTDNPINDSNINNNITFSTQPYINDVVQKINKTHQLFANINTSIKRQPLLFKIDNTIINI